VSFEPLADLERLRDELHADFYELCSDPQRRVYSAFGLARLPRRHLLGWRTLRVYGRAALAGRLEWKRGSDVEQGGGDFVLDERGRIRLAYVSREPADRPSTDLVLAALSSP
jgi:peroxiredoxin